MAFIPDEVIDDMYLELTSGARDLYIFLARCRNQKSGKCCPSIATITSSICLSRPRIYALRKELQEKKWAEFSGNDAILLKGYKSIEIKTSDEETKGVVLDMTVSLENKTESLENKTPSLKNKTKSLENKTNESQKQDSYIRKNQQIEPVKEPIEESSSSDPVIQIFDHWKKVLNHPRAVLDLKRKRSIKARLKEGFTPDDLISAIDGCLSSDWHMGRHEKNNIEQGGKIYDDISLICRDASKVEQFISYQTENKKQEADQKPERCPECRGAGKVPVRGLLNRAADGSRMEPCPTCQKKVEVVNGNASITAGSLRLATA